MCCSRNRSLSPWSTLMSSACCAICPSRIFACRSCSCSNSWSCFRSSSSFRAPSFTVLGLGAICSADTLASMYLKSRSRSLLLSEASEIASEISSSCCRTRTATIESFDCSVRLATSTDSSFTPRLSMLCLLRSNSILHFWSSAAVSLVPASCLATRSFSSSAAFKLLVSCFALVLNSPRSVSNWRTLATSTSNRTLVSRVRVSASASSRLSSSPLLNISFRSRSASANAARNFAVSANASSRSLMISTTLFSTSSFFRTASSISIATSSACFAAAAFSRSSISSCLRAAFNPCPKVLLSSCAFLSLSSRSRSCSCSIRVRSSVDTVSAPSPSGSSDCSKRDTLSSICRQR
mmetsp:Transcript_52802/g.124708  ORF Transcript_52802/g.124708 Transcript_52802/m.124708 type:complete len:351 (+) Transcript_52802:1068-2120(+)